MSQDTRLQDDLLLLEELAHGRVDARDPRLAELLVRRPQWRELAEQAHGAVWSGEPSEGDRELVAECLAEARATEPRPAARTRRPRLLFALAAGFVAVCALLVWRSQPSGPQRTDDPLLNEGSQVGFFEQGVAESDFSQFKWTCKEVVTGRETFVLTIWAAQPDGSRGRELKRYETHDREFRVAAQDREHWPDEIVWRVDCIDSNGTPSASSQPWRARRAPR